MDPEDVQKKKWRDMEVKNRIKKMSKEALQAAMSKKKECNARALLIVEQLIEPNVQETFLLENLKHINQSHFQDIVEERAISRSCGYPLCDGEITNVPKKKYKISTRENKVYDITDRKNYCSNVCYKAGTFLKDQLYTSPLWLRDTEIPVEYKTLASTKVNKFTGVGAEIDLGNTKPVKLDKKLDGDNVKLNNDPIQNKVESPTQMPDQILLENAKCGVHEAVVESEQNGKPCVGNIENQLLNVTYTSNNDENNHPPNPKTNFKCEDLDGSTQTNLGATNNYQGKSSVNETNSKLKESRSYDGEFCSNEPLEAVGSDKLEKMKVNDEGMFESSNPGNPTDLTVSNEIPTPKAVRGKCKSGKSKRKDERCSPFIAVISHMEQNMKSWFTIETMLFLLGQKHLREILKVSGFKEHMVHKKEDHVFYQKCQEIYRRLNLLELQDKEKQVPVKPVPELGELVQKSKEMELKVKSFYRGDTKVTFVDEWDEENEEKNLELYKTTDEPFLPPIDHCSVTLTRQRIFLENLNKVLPDMQEALDLTQFRLGREIHELVSTFNLGPSNIMMRSSEWRLVVVVIIKLLTLRNERLSFAYYQDLTQKRIFTYLLTFDLDGGYLDRFTSYLLDVERVASEIVV